MPISRPVTSAVTILVFAGVRSNFLWPLLVVTDPEMMPLPTFVEHMGRCVYTGIHEPGHP
ncbi:hypothetical protein ACIOKD_13755 [Streptomyces sp. NPDC087844]|uniref:hypothetical protein n=1 Tax=Streptomyces sp. NPDC087844 TaxID=3365805 RepID=UPI003820F3D2